MRLRAVVGVSVALAFAGGAGAVILETSSVSVEVHDTNGRILRLFDTSLGGELMPPAGLAENFRLVVETDGRRSTIFGAQQKMTRTSRDFGVLILEWDGPLIDDAGASHAIAFRMIATAGEEAIAFRCGMQNNSTATVVEVWCPVVAGLESFATPEQRAQTALYPPPANKTLASPFGAYALNYPSGLNMGFMDLNNTAANRGLYIGLHEKVARIKRFHYAETVHGDDSTIVAAIVHSPYAKRGTTFEGCPSIFRFHEGDWLKGGRVYRDWFASAFGIMEPADDWIRRESFFQMIMMMLPEGNINYTFKEVPQLARDGLKYGVRSLQLAGWQRGGHDNGYPYYEPDPRLGTWDDVAAALDECHELGVKVYFFVNFQPVMMDLAWYRDELKDYVSLNADGAEHWIAGWGMGTLASRMGDTTPLMAFADVSFAGMSDILAGYFRKLAEVGADGLHVDKMFPAALDYNPRLMLGPDTAPWEGAVRLMERIDLECRAINPDFRMSFECNWDRVLQYGCATWWAGNMTTAKMVFPEVAETVGHYMPYDFLGLNRAVRLGHAVMIAPYKFNRSMNVEAWRQMAEYVAEVKRIRDGLSEVVYFGEMLPGDQVAFGEKGLPGGVEMTLWRSLADGRRACILANNAMTPAEMTLAGLGGSAGAVSIQAPFQAEIASALPARIHVPAEGMVFVVEQDAGPAESPVNVAIATDSDQNAPGDALVLPFANADFENGLAGWTADANCRVDNNSAGGWYSGWQGHGYAWSGEGGESATGRMRSPVFTLAKTGVEVAMAGWADMWGRTADRWNYVTLNLADGTELDRRYVPNSVAFTPVELFAANHVGKEVYIEAVDDAPENTFSMLCIDSVKLVDVHLASAVPQAAESDVHVLESDFYRVEIDRSNGAIRRVCEKKGGLELIREPRLADNFEFSLPIKKHEGWMNTEANYICGRNQKLSACARRDNGLTLAWGPPLRSVFGVDYDASVVMNIDLSETDVVFGLRINNDSGLEIGEVYYPIIGGVLGLGETQSDLKGTILTLPYGTSQKASRPFHVFDNMSPFGSLYPEQYHRYPDALSMPWLDLCSPRLRRGLTFAAYDTVPRNKILHLLQMPGTASPRTDGNWPRPEELEGRPAGVRLSLVQIVYQPAGKPFEASPVVLRFHDGDWRSAAVNYGAWFREETKAQDAGAEYKYHSCGRIPYAQIPEQGQAAVAAGANMLLLTDWKLGGQNNGVPRFEVDPALGTLGELAAGIAACHGLGVRVVFLLNLQYANPDSAWFLSEGHRYASVDRWGVPGTWGAQRWRYINPAYPELRAALCEQVRTLAGMGADGVHLRNFFPLAMDFNPALQRTPDRAGYEGGIECIAEMMVAAREKNAAFEITTDAVRDWLTPISGASEAEANEPSPFAAAFPQWRELKPAAPAE